MLLSFLTWNWSTSASLKFAVSFLSNTSKNYQLFVVSTISNGEFIDNFWIFPLERNVMILKYLRILWRKESECAVRRIYRVRASTATWQEELSLLRALLQSPRRKNQVRCARFYSRLAENSSWHVSTIFRYWKKYWYWFFFNSLWDYWILG